MKRTLFALAVLIFLAQPVSAAPESVKLFVQWAQSTPNDWTLVDSSVWSNQPTNSDPIDVVSGSIVGDSLLTNQKGYVFALNVQGVEFNWYDHYAVTSDDTSVTVTAWRDDATLFTLRQADVGIFKPLKWDAKVGQNNTDQTFIVYREGAEYDALVGHVPENTTLRPYSEFVAPAAVDTKPGIYLSDSKWQEHISAETIKGWR